MPWPSLFLRAGAVSRCRPLHIRTHSVGDARAETTAINTCTCNSYHYTSDGITCTPRFLSLTLFRTCLDGPHQSLQLEVLRAAALPRRDFTSRLQREGAGTASAAPHKTTRSGASGPYRPLSLLGPMGLVVLSCECGGLVVTHAPGGGVGEETASTRAAYVRTRTRTYVSRNVPRCARAHE